MPRIRTLKPEHKVHRKVGPLGHLTYRLWVGLITESDDDGRVIGDLAQLRALIFPYHTLTLAKIEAALAELARLGLIVRHQADGITCLWFPSWHDHQKRDTHHYKPSKLPAPPTLARQSLDGDSAESLGSLDGDDTTGRKGREWKGT